MTGIRWSEEDLEEYLARHNRSAVPAANVERNPRHAVKKPNAHQKNGERVRIHIHSKRKRLADPGGICDKAAIDGLRLGGLLINDSAKEVIGVTESQELSSEEETIITIEAFKDE